MKRRPELRKHASLVIGAGLICALASLALLAPWIAPHHPVLDADLMSAAEPPSGAFPLGTDAQGRDILSRILYGARISLTIGLVSQIINTLIGVTLGVSAGYFGGWWDDLVNGLTNLMLGIPSLIFALAIMAVLGPGVPSLLLALGLTNWSYTCRIARSQTLTIRSLAYAEAARAIGCGNARIMAVHILPNMLGPLIVMATLGMGSAVLAEASLSFLGLGVQAPQPSWGSMLSEARDQLLVAPWVSVFPGIAIFACVLGFNLLGDGLRDLTSPRRRQ